MSEKTSIFADEIGEDRLHYLYAPQKQKIMSDLKSYRLTSMEEPTDEQLSAIMLQVGELARESSRDAQLELDRRMNEVRKRIAARHKKTN